MIMDLSLLLLSCYLAEAVRSKVKLFHPESEDLAYLYGTIITDGKDTYSSDPTANLTVFANAEVVQFYTKLCQ